MNSHLTRNITTTVLQVIIASIVYFWLYRYLIRQLRLEEIGVYSLVVAFASLAALGNFGISSSIVRYVALYEVRNERNKLGDLVMTSFLSLSVVFILIGLLIFLISSTTLSLIINSEYLELGTKVLPFSLLSMLLLALSGIFSSVLEGLQKNYLKNYIYIGSSLLFIVLVLLLVPENGLIGVAIAQVLQSLFILVACFFVSVRVSACDFFGSSFRKKIFFEVLSYGSKFQALSIINVCFEPITKLLIGYFATLGFLGYYEMASRLVGQVRSLLVSANQVLIPVIIQNAADAQKDKLFLKKSFSFNISITALVMALLMVATPLISSFWIGTIEPAFISISSILIIGFTINTYSGFIFFSMIAKGQLNALMVNQSILGLINLAGGFLLGKMIGAYGPVIAWALALIIASFLLIRRQFSELSIRREIFNRRKLFFISLILALSLMPVCVSLLDNISVPVHFALAIGISLFVIGLSVYNITADTGQSIKEHYKISG